jgi:hypothetical protein
MSETKEDQLAALLATVERLRVDRYPGLNAGMVREVLLAHADPSAPDTDLSRVAEKLIERYLSGQAGVENA